MKNLTLLFTILILCFAAQPSALAQATVATPKQDAEALLSGEHAVISYSGSTRLNGAASVCSTAWMPIGWAPGATKSANENILRLVPREFTVALKAAVFNCGDSVSIDAARFEWALDTAGAAGWNADSSNVFIASDAFASPDYGLWRFAPVADSSRYYACPLRVVTEGYLRLVLASNLSDSTSVGWTLIGRR